MSRKDIQLYNSFNSCLHFVVQEIVNFPSRLPYVTLNEKYIESSKYQQDKVYNGPRDILFNEN